MATTISSDSDNQRHLLKRTMNPQSMSRPVTIGRFPSVANERNRTPSRPPQSVKRGSNRALKIVVVLLVFLILGGYLATRPASWWGSPLAGVAVGPAPSATTSAILTTTNAFLSTRTASSTQSVAQISAVLAPCPAQHTCASGNWTYAQTWQQSSGNFEIRFSISGLESAYGNGVYTFYLWPVGDTTEPITSVSLFVTGA
jgi:hypothetical protein